VTGCRSVDRRCRRCPRTGRAPGAGSCGCRDRGSTGRSRARRCRSLAFPARPRKRPSPSRPRSSRWSAWCALPPTRGPRARRLNDGEGMGFFADALCTDDAIESRLTAPVSERMLDLASLRRGCEWSISRAAAVSRPFRAACRVWARRARCSAWTSPTRCSRSHETRLGTQRSRISLVEQTRPSPARRGGRHETCGCQPPTRQEFRTSAGVSQAGLPARLTGGVTRGARGAGRARERRAFWHARGAEVFRARGSGASWPFRQGIAEAQRQMPRLAVQAK
jgi:hypothetical protein